VDQRDPATAIPVDLEVVRLPSSSTVSLTSSVAIVVNFYMQFVAEDLGFINATVAVSYITTKLATAVAVGQFTETLQLGSTVGFANVQAASPPKLVSTSFVIMRSASPSTLPTIPPSDLPSALPSALPPMAPITARFLLILAYFLLLFLLFPYH